eukprot:TRINITY_DN1534_c0_g1_i1.p3 TRINITY_DN1534_c0_g1~~TRINITY_DN1534_c0_g1_i1.p3  ORF type:complete len:242 (+),score=38.04 TRINITY_DN1534_c0_g1_i1:1625-2350(+)
MEIINTGINERTIMCDSGFFATPPNNAVINLTGNQPFFGCLDFNECNFGCASGTLVVACTDSTSDSRVPPNTRVCTCPSGYMPFNQEMGSSNVSLVGSELFEGYIDCTSCPFNSYLLKPCTATSSRTCQACESCPDGYWVSSACTGTLQTQCSKCNESCPEGYYIASPCTTQHDLVCLPCDPPCIFPTFESKSCANGLNRVCGSVRTPVCVDGCGKGTCIDVLYRKDITEQIASTTATARV